MIWANYHIKFTYAARYVRNFGSIQCIAGKELTTIANYQSTTNLSSYLHSVQVTTRTLLTEESGTQNKL